MSCREQLAGLKKQLGEARLAYARNGMVRSKSRGDRSVSYKSGAEAQAHITWIENEVRRLEGVCGDPKPCGHVDACGCPVAPAWSHERSISFTGGAW